MYRCNSIAVFSDGDFVKISVGRRAAPVKESTMSVEEEEEKDDVDVDEQSPKLFTCPVDGCVKLLQRYSSLEYHCTYSVVHVTLSLKERIYSIWPESYTETSF